MGKTVYVALCQQLLGPRGVYWSDIGPIHEVVCDYVYMDYYQDRQLSSREVILGYIGGYKALSPKIIKHYQGNAGRNQLRSNMYSLLTKSLSMHKIICICEQANNWLSSTNLPGKEALDMSNYCSSQPTLDDAALYLADILHYVMYIT